MWTAISWSGETEVQRSLSTFTKFPQLAGGRVGISTHRNLKPTPLIARLCCLVPNGNSDDYSHPWVSPGGLIWDGGGGKTLSWISKSLDAQVLT